jgi:hypothetical protein
MITVAHRTDEIKIFVFHQYDRLLYFWYKPMVIQELYTLWIIAGLLVNRTDIWPRLKSLATQRINMQ